jgi:hypothetical protein
LANIARFRDSAISDVCHSVVMPAIARLESVTQDGDAFEESVILKVEGFGPSLPSRSVDLPSFLNGGTAFTLDLGELLSRHYPQYCAGFIESEMAQIIALVETFPVRDTCEILTGHLMASIGELMYRQTLDPFRGRSTNWRVARPDRILAEMHDVAPISRQMEGR